jgi:hypothetical protein
LHGRGRRGTAAHGGSSRRQRALAGKTTRGSFFGAPLGFGFLLASRIFLALARFGGLTLYLFGGIALGASLGLGFLATAILFLAFAGTDKGAGAGIALLVRQSAQHHA